MKTSLTVLYTVCAVLAVVSFVEAIVDDNSSAVVGWLCTLLWIGTAAVNRRR